MGGPGASPEEAGSYVKLDADNTIFLVVWPDRPANCG